MFMIVIAEEKKTNNKNEKKKMRKCDVQQSVNQIYLKFKT